MLARPLELKSFSNLWRFVSRLVTSRRLGTFLFSVWVCQTKTWNGNDETYWELNLEDIFKYMIKGSYRLPSTSRYFKLSHLQNQLNVVSLHSNTIQKTMTKQNKTDPTPKRAQNSFSQLFTKFANLLHSNQPCPRRQALNLADHWRRNKPVQQKNAATVATKESLNLYLGAAVC